MMKRTLLIISFIAGLVLSGFSQPLRDGGNGKLGSRVEALKIAFLTKKLDLSTEEAQRFWPVYNQYNDEVIEVRQQQRQNKLSQLEMEEKVLKIRKKYNVEITKALNAEKANTFFAAEKEFGNVVAKEWAERKEARKNRNQ